MRYAAERNNDLTEHLWCFEYLNASQKSKSIHADDKPEHTNTWQIPKQRIFQE